MKKTIFTLAALCMAVAANATILRVSNVEGSSAPYSDLQVAVDAANVGDTIMVDGSTVDYMTDSKAVEISKKLVIIGPGYWIAENGLAQEAFPAAKTKFVVHTDAAGTVIEGFSSPDISSGVIFQINADNCVIRRCYIHSGTNYGIRFGKDDWQDEHATTGAVICQNFFDNSVIQGHSSVLTSNVQVTNNIFVDKGKGEEDIESLTNSYIAYNTMIGEYPFDSWHNFAWVWSSTIEHNIIREQHVRYSSIADGDNNSWSDNYATVTIPDSNGEAVHTTWKTDKDIRDAELALTGGKNYGAFAGGSPYVLSGIPAAPVIQDLVMPTTVEKGKKMNVTIKVGIQK